MGALRVVDFIGRFHSEPSTRSRFRAVGARRVSLDNPFTPTILGRFVAGGLDEVHEFRDLGEFYDEHDPEKAKGIASLVAGYVFQPGLSLAGPPGGPGLVRTVRVGQGAQIPVAASYNAQDYTPETVGVFEALDAGTLGNHLRVKVENATGGAGNGRKVSVGYRDNPTWIKVGDKLGPLFTLDYTGNGASATVAVTMVGDKATRLQVTLVGASDGSVSLDLDLTSSDFSTVQRVVDYISRQIGYTAVAADTDLSLGSCPSYEIDNPGAHELVAAGALVVTAKLGSVTAWCAENTQRIGPVKGVKFTRTPTKTAYLDEMNAFAQLAGGLQPAVIAEDWDEALEVLDREEVPHGLLIIDSDDSGVQAQVKAWIDSQYAVQGRIWRAVFGLPGATTAAAARTYAAKTDSTRIGVVHQRMLDFDDPSITRDPLFAAAALGGATGGMRFATDAQSAVLTKRRLRFGGILKADRQAKSVREASIDAGVMPFRLRRGGRVELTLNRSTYLERGTADDRFRMLWSESVELDAIAISIEERLEPLEVAWAEDSYVASVRDEVTQVLRAWETRGFITAGADPATGETRPAFTPPLVEVLAGQTSISFDIGMAGETDHLRISATIRRVALSSEA